MKITDMTLEDLFLLAKKGSGAAFEQIVIRTEKEIYSLALSITRSREDAEDATQETYMRLWKSINDYKGASAKCYLFKTARNIAIDIIRKKGKREIIDLNEAIETEDAEYDLRPDEAYIKKLTVDTVRECINALPLPMRELIVMRDIDGLSYSEMASILGIPEGSVKSGLFRARERLRRLIIEKNIL